MNILTSLIRYMGEYQAIFQYKEYSFAKHTHFQDKRKDRKGMSSPG